MEIQIILKNHERYSLHKDEIFLVKKGKIISKNIAANGKIVCNNLCLEKGEILMNYFYFLENVELEIEVEIEALEESILERINLNEKKGDIFEKILYQLIRKGIAELKYHLYNTKGYILMMMKVYANEKGVLKKKDVKAEHFNIGRTQFFKVYKELKKEKFLEEKGQYIYLDLVKIDDYLIDLEF